MTKHKIQYHNAKDREEIINNNKDKHLVEEQNITEGNFLIFSEEPPTKEIIYVEVPEGELKSYENRIIDLELTIAEMLSV